MPIGNALAVLRSIRPMAPQNVSFFTDPYSGTFNGIYIDYNLNGLDKIWLTDATNHSIIYINTNKQNKNNILSYQWNGHGNAVGLNSMPCGMVRDYDNNLYIVEVESNNIKKFDANGVETNAFLGHPWGEPRYSNVEPGAFAFSVRQNIGEGQNIAVDSNNNLYICDTGNSVIRKIVYDKTKSTFPTVTTLAGPEPANNAAVNSADIGNVDGTGSAAKFNAPLGIAIDLNDNIYVADMGNNTIRKITTNGVVTTIAGDPKIARAIDGIGTAACFNGPAAICCDFDGNIYVAEGYHIRKITPTISGGITTYVVSTLAGNGFSLLDLEGDYLSVALFNIKGIQMMHDGNLLVTSRIATTTFPPLTDANRIKKIKNTTGYKTNFNITISTNRANIVLENLLYRRGWDGKSPVTCTLTISSGVTVYGYTPDPSLTIGAKLNSSTINIINNGSIIGLGGAGGTFVGASYYDAKNGQAGIYARTNINLINNGLIAGGGGGGAAGGPTNSGGGGGGGGGGGYGVGGKASSASNGTVGRYGTLLLGGVGGTGAAAGGNIANKGGDSGYNDGAGTFILNKGGPAGNAIDGISYVTLNPSSTGSLSGATIN